MTNATGGTHTLVSEVVEETAGADLECAVAGRLADQRVPGFGASDRSCESHLAVADQ